MTNPGATGIVASETKVLTLFASDGTTVSQDPDRGTGMMYIYTVNNGDDDTSPGHGVVTPGTPLHTWIFTTNYGFHSIPTGNLPETGSVTYSESTNALCLEVPAAGDNRGEWGSPYGGAQGIDLVDNAVYHARITGRTSQVDYNKIPYWMFHFENGSSTGDPANTALGCYTSEHFFLTNDAQGGANAIGSRVLEIYYAPLAFRTPQWKSPTAGAFDPTYATQVDMRVRFRVFDAGTPSGGSDVGGWQADNDVGQLCLEELDLERFDYGDVVADSVVHTWTANLTEWRAGVLNGAANRLTTAEDGAGVTLTPNGGAWTDQGCQFVPGDGNLNAAGGYPAADVNDDYPVAWEANQLYQVDVEMSNPAWSAPFGNSSDVIRVGMDVPTAEIGFMNGQTPNVFGWGTPNATKATYTMFFFSHDVSLNPTPQFNRIRPRIDMLNASTFSPNGITTGATDPIKIFTIKVSKVHF
jgi:hypothetical protein